MDELQYGKVITSESYYEGKVAKKQCGYSIPILVNDKSQVLSEIIKAIDLITSKQTHLVILTIEAGKDHQLKKVTKEYMTESDY